jgi:glycerol uptake facilitator-like aquaporin
MTTMPEIPDRGPAAYVAEFIGTLFLVFFITAAVSLFITQPTQQNPNPFIDWSVIGLVHLLVLFVLIQTLAVICGAHFNPAITAALTALRQIKPPDAAIYILAQLAGGVAGALLTKGLLLDEGRAINYGAALVSDARLEGEIFPGMVAEALGTFFLVWAVVGVAVNPRAARDWAALAIGGALG